MSKKINIVIPNKVRPDLVSLFHAYLSRKSNEVSSHSSYNDMDDDEYSAMLEYWDRMFPGWDKDDYAEDDVNDYDVVYPPSDGGTSNVIVMKPRRDSKGSKRHRERDVYNDFWSQREREESWCRSDKKKKHHSRGKSKRKLFDITKPYSGEEDEYSFDDIGLDYGDGEKEIWFYPDYHCKDDRLEFNSLSDFNDYCGDMGYLVTKDVMEDILYRYESHCCLNPESEKVGLLDVMSGHSYGEMFYDACDESELSGE